MKRNFFSVRFERVVVIGIIEYMIRAMYTIHLLYFRVSYGPRGKFSGLLAILYACSVIHFSDVEKNLWDQKIAVI